MASNTSGFLFDLVTGGFAAALQGASICTPTVAFTVGFLLVYLGSLDWLKIQRQLEGRIGGYLIESRKNKVLKSSKLVCKKITLTQSPETRGITVHYYERLPVSTGNGNQSSTLLLCHGMTSGPKELSALVRELSKKLPEWRMILPAALGHGEDLERAKELGPKFEYPTPLEMGEPIRDLLLELGIPKCCAYGYSLGGALVYFLQDKHPELIQKSILTSPGMEAVLDDEFVEDWEKGRKNHHCWESREDVQQFLEDMSSHGRSPVPSFLLQAIWEDRQRRAPPQHFRNYFQHLLNQRGKDPQWLGCPQDCAPHLSRLVLWPMDDLCCNHDKGKAFFAKSTKTDFRSIPDCGHVFHSDGQTVHIRAAPMLAQYLLEDHK